MVITDLHRLKAKNRVAASGLHYFSMRKQAHVLFSWPNRMSDEDQRRKNLHRAAVTRFQNACDGTRCLSTDDGCFVKYRPRIRHAGIAP